MRKKQVEQLDLEFKDALLMVMAGLGLTSSWPGPMDKAMPPDSDKIPPAFTWHYDNMALRHHPIQR